MKKILFLAAFLLVAQATQAQVILQWDYDTAKDKFCSATVTEDCVKEFGVGIVVNGAVTQIATVVPSSCTTATVAVCTTPTLPSIQGRKYKLNTFVAWAVSADGFKSINSNTVDDQKKPGTLMNLRSQ